MKPSRLKGLLLVFLWVGSVGFGGPLATISMMEEEFVERRSWLTREKFAELFAVCKLLPGPIASQMAISVGKEIAGTAAGICSGILFTLPALVLVTAIAAVYVHGPVFAHQEQVFHGMQLGAIAIIAASLVHLFQPYYRELRPWVIAAASLALTAVHPPLEPIYILGAGAMGILAFRRSAGAAALSLGGAAMATWVTPSRALAASTVVFLGAGRLWPLFWACFKAAAFVFGTGIAVVPMLEHDFVHNLGWLTHSEFMDAVAVGQITPGPFVITATFIGYKAAGLVGASIASLGIFLPSFFNVLVLVPLIWGRFSRSPASKVFVAWAMPAVVGAIGAATVKLTRGTVANPWDAAIILLGIVGSLRWKWPSWAIVPGSGLVLLGLRAGMKWGGYLP